MGRSGFELNFQEFHYLMGPVPTSWMGCRVRFFAAGPAGSTHVCGLEDCSLIGLTRAGFEPETGRWSPRTRSLRDIYITGGHSASFCDMTIRSSSTSLWEVPVREGREVLTSEALSTMARRIGAKPEHALRHLRREGYLLPLFRGYYYVRTPEELRLHIERHDPLELFALAARAKGIGAWYYGLHTALRLNGLTHEDRREEAVVSRSIYRIHGVPIGGHRFVIHRWGAKLFGFGLERRATYRVSDPEKTVLDLAYLDHWTANKGHPVARTWVEHLGSIDARKVRRYLSHYPEEVRRTVEGRL